MPVQTRIKILEVNNFEEVENKVNDFLAFDENIAQLIGIDYRLEYKIVIIQYYAIARYDNDGSRIVNRSEDRQQGWGDYNYGCSGPLTWWLRFCFPFSFHP